MSPVPKPLPAFAHASPATRPRRSTISTPTMRIAARARLSSADSNRLRKRRKTEHASTTSASRTVSQPAVPLPVADRVLAAEKKMSDALTKVRFTGLVSHVYDPLKYAWNAHEWYVNQFGNSRKDILLVGMNPGPWGMAQTGVPFGEVSAVRDWMGMPSSIVIGKPENEHPKRPVTGLSCARSEVSGKRFWTEWARKTYGDDPKDFFNRFYVHNYCPLMFLESSGKNRTPVQLRAYERKLVSDICDKALREVVQAVKPRVVCGVGGFATERCRFALKDLVEKGLLIQGMLHPSPASPIANRGWAGQAAEMMQKVVMKISESEDVWAPKSDN